MSRKQTRTAFVVGLACAAASVAALLSCGRDLETAEPASEYLLAEGAAPTLVGIARDSASVENAVNAAVSLVGGFPFDPAGKTVMLKPNLNSGDPIPFSTSPAVVSATIKLLKSAGARRIIVADRSNPNYNTIDAAKKAGIYSVAINLGAEVVDLGTAGFRTVTPAGATHWSGGYQIAKFLDQVDYIINLPVCKDHSAANYTMSIKAWYGIVSQNDRSRGHGVSLQEMGHMLAELHLGRKEDFIIMDASQIVLTGGPYPGGATAAPGLIVATKDPVANDVTGLAILKHYLKQKGIANSKIDNYTVWTQPQIVRATEIGIGIRNNSQYTASNSGVSEFNSLMAYIVPVDPCTGVQGGGAGLKGTTFGVNPPYAAGSEYCRAFDGSTSTFYNAASASGAYTGLDLGTAKVISSIRFYPRSGNTGRITNGKFQGSNTSSSSGYVDLYTVTNNPPLQWNTVNVSNTTAYRWVRYLSPTNGYGNVAEVEFYQPTTQYTLSTSATNGTIGLNPPGGSYASGTVVTLTATPAAGYAFAGWSGDLTGTANPASLAMNGNKSVTASFSAASTPVTYEAEGLTRTASAVGSGTSNDPNASGGAYVQLTGTPGVNDYIQFTIPNLAVGTYDVKMVYKSNNNRAIVQASIDGANQGAVCDEYAAASAFKVACALGSKSLAAGNHLFRFTVTGKRAASTGYTMTVDSIVLTALGSP